ncbi:MAG TPA: FG-GAP-like repeat-containing protein [Pyrinomonadaceae bacterium]
MSGGTAGEIASGDFNDDGRTDVVFPHAGAVSVLLGKANGAPSVVQITSVSQPAAVGVGHFNNDRKLDLAVSHGFNPSFVAVLLGDGAGNFGAPVDYAANLSKPVVVADFNNDGHADVFLGNSSTNNSQVLLGDGAGALASPFFVLIPNNSRALSADFNNDGKKDLATVYDGSGFVSVALGDGTGHFGSAMSFPIGTPLFGNLAAGDLNGDGKTDLVTAGQGDGVSVLLGNGMGSFSPASSVSTGFGTAAVSLGDFNADSKMDIATGGGTTLTILLGNGSGSFVATRNYAVADSISNMLVVDGNGDSKSDVVTVNCSGCFGSATLLFGDGSGTLRFPSTLPGLSPFSIVTGDWNNDAKADLAVANISHNNVSIYLANGVGGFSAPTNFAVATQPRSVAKGDINGDQKLDLVTANYSPNTVSILLGDGFGGFGPATTLNMPGFNPDYATLSDFNNDGKLDLAVGYGSANIISILLGNGTGGFGAANNFSVINGVLQIDVGDFNSDGKADIAAAAIGGVAVLLGNGNGGFGTATIFPTNTAANSIVVSDFNGDGNADLAAGLGNNNQVLLYAGNGQGVFAAPVSFNTIARPDALSLADYNGDGNADLAASGTTSRTSVLLGDGLGGFPATASYLNGGTVTRSLTSGDFNADGRPDIALANQGNVSILINSCAATPQQLPTLSIADVTLTESDSGTVKANFQVTLSAPSSKTVSVSFYTAAKDALRNVDYQTVSGRLMFAPGVTNQTIEVPIIGDTTDEFDEQYNVILAFPLNATLSNTSALGTVVDNDPPPTISISDASLSEGNAGTTGIVFAVNLSAPSGKPISVAFATSDGSATSGSDYVAASGVINSSAGETSKTISVQVNGDWMYEGNETFFATLSNPNNVTISRAQATGTIVTDDAILLLEQGTNHVVAIDSVTFVRDPFSVSGLHNFSSDQRTRVMIFTANLGLTQPNSDLAVTAGGIPLTVEAVGTLAGVPDFSYVIVKLDPMLTGTVQLTVTLRGVTSNAGVLNITP